MEKIQCLECANDIELKKDVYKIGEILECSYCGTELEVLEMKEGKLVLDIIEEEK